MKSNNSYRPQAVRVSNDDQSPPATTQTDQQLLDAFALGDHHALCILFTRYQNFLHNQCRNLMRGNPDDAKDLFSLVIMKFYNEQPEQLRKVRHLGGWLNRIARNKHIDILRERQADERRDQGLGYLDQVMENFPPSPEQIAINAELSRQLHYAFDQLPDRIRLAAKLRFEEDASYETISNTLDISQVCARKRVQDARRLLISTLNLYLNGGQSSHHSSKKSSAARCFLDKKIEKTRDFNDSGKESLQ